MTEGGAVEAAIEAALAAIPEHWANEDIGDNERIAHHEYCLRDRAEVRNALQAIAQAAQEEAEARIAKPDTSMTAAEWTALILEDNGGVRDDGHWHAEHCPGVPAYPCHCIVIENEMSDYRMILDHCTTVYDEASGGRVSKPNTLPSVVLDFMREDRSKDVDECVAEAVEEAEAANQSIRDKLSEQVGATVAARLLLSEAEAKVARLRQALERWGSHDPGCRETFTMGREPCDCGWAAALADVQKPRS